MKLKRQKSITEDLYYWKPASAMVSAQEKKDLEASLKEKVSPLLEETMERQWGITIPKIGSDITDQLKKPQLNIYVSSRLPFPKAKKEFKSEFIKMELRLHRGNISQLAKTIGLDRRSIHRSIKNLEINLGQVRGQPEEREAYQKAFVDQTIRATLEHYKELIQPQKLDIFYQELPRLSDDIAKIVPHQDWKWKEAKHEFERQFLLQALQEQQWNITRTAEKVKMRVETLHRKIRKLGLRTG